jgi:hypothetical protein
MRETINWKNMNAQQFYAMVSKKASAFALADRLGMLNQTLNWVKV